MGHTIAEKILAAHAGGTAVRAGDVVVASVDFAIDLAAGKVAIAARNLDRTTAALPPPVQRILAAGGLIQFLQKHPDWKLT